MKGHPVLRTILFLLVWSTLLPAVLILTSSTASPPRIASSDPTVTTTPAWIHLRFAHAPERIELAAGAISLIHETTPIDLDIETQVDLPLQNASLILDLTVDWKDVSHPTIVELTIEPEGLPAREVHFWAEDRCRRKVQLSW